MLRGLFQLQEALINWHPSLWTQIKHYGDSTVTTRNGATGESAREIAAAEGFNIRPVSNNWTKRHVAVTWALRRKLEGHQLFTLDPHKCPTLRAGFQGEYTLRTLAPRAEGATDPQRHPVKSAHSHVQDALQYALLEIRRALK